MGDNTTSNTSSNASNTTSNADIPHSYIHLRNYPRYTTRNIVYLPPIDLTKETHAEVWNKIVHNGYFNRPIKITCKDSNEPYMETRLDRRNCDIFYEMEVDILEDDTELSLRDDLIHLKTIGN